MLKTFFNNIARKFMVTKLNNLTFDAFDNSVFILQVLALFKDMLDDIVAELVLC